MNQPAETNQPLKQSQYLKVAPSTKRYRLLMALSEETGATWQQICRIAIDTYLTKNPPKKQT